MASLLLAILTFACSEPAAERIPMAPSARTPASRAENLGEVRFAAVGDTGDGSSQARILAEAIAAAHRREPLDVLLLLGDLIYPHGSPAQYEAKFTNPYRSVIEAGIPTAAVLGNHDLETNPHRFMELFAMPGRYYSFTVGAADFFALDTSRGSVDAEQQRWLERELPSTSSPWKIAFMHVPLFSDGMHGSNLALQEALIGRFRRYGVQLALAGHDHNYQRIGPINGTTYLVSGGGCCPRPVPPQGALAGAVQALHFVVVELSGEVMLIEAVDAEGRVFDRTEIMLAPAAAA